MASVIAGMWGARRDHALVSCTFLNGQVGVKLNQRLYIPEYQDLQYYYIFST